MFQLIQRIIAYWFRVQAYRWLSRLAARRGCCLAAPIQIFIGLLDALRIFRPGTGRYR